MKIGIMSMQRIRNYGSFLQAYALKQLVERHGNEVVFVDYQLQEELVKRPDSSESIIKKITKNLNIIKFIEKKIKYKLFTDGFDKVFIPSLCGNNHNYLDKTIEALIIGSDEVFNCLQPFPVGFSKELFGEHYEKIPVISYAASFGQTTLERLREYNIDKTVSSLLKRFKAISVRDRNSYEIVSELTGEDPNLNLDPVLMYDFSDDIVDNVRVKDYILIYSYPERLTEREKKTIRSFARKHNKKIISLGLYNDVADENIVVSPFEVMPYFKHADFVITDTFHGSIFSVKTHSNFCAIVRSGKFGNGNKLSDLLKRINKEEVIISDISEIEKAYKRKIDFSRTDNIIEKEKINTEKYLVENILGGKK